MSEEKKNDDGWGGNPWLPEVGYKKPPKHARFKPGQSGNPKGRRKSVKNSRLVLEEVLNSVTTVTEGGVLKKMSREKVMLTMLIGSAMKGSPRAVALVYKLMQEFGMLKELDAPTRNILIRLVRPDGKVVPLGKGSDE